MLTSFAFALAPPRSVANFLRTRLDIDASVKVLRWCGKGSKCRSRKLPKGSGSRSECCATSSYSEADLRRAGRIRDLIATGFSTREVRSMAACLSDEGAGPCEGGIPQLLEKLEHIDRLRADLDAKREAVLDRLAIFRESLSIHHERNDPHHATPDTSLPDRFPRGGR